MERLNFDKKSENTNCSTVKNINACARTLKVAQSHHCCQVAQFWATGLKSDPVKILAALKISRVEIQIPNFIIAA